MADRKNQGKAPMHLIPREAIEDEAGVFEFGMKKYSVGNWMSPPYFPREVLIDCVLRHAFAMAAGEDIDPESGLGHWAHIRCNMAMYAYQRRWQLFPEGDTQVHQEKRQEASTFHRDARLQELSLVVRGQRTAQGILANEKNAHEVYSQQRERDVAFVSSNPGTVSAADRLHELASEGQGR